MANIWANRIIDAINPVKFKIERAWLFLHYFGEGKHAVNFGGYNTPYYAAETIEWELIPTEKPV